MSVDKAQRPIRRAGSDRGSGTVLALGVIVTSLSLLVGALHVIRAVVTGHRAAAAADLAALAAAAERTAGHDGAVCRSAGRVAALNGATLTRCSAEQNGVIRVVVVVASSMPWSMTATAHSRAGPADPTAVGSAPRHQRARSPTASRSGQISAADSKLTPAMARDLLDQAADDGRVFGTWISRAVLLGTRTVRSTP